MSGARVLTLNLAHGRGTSFHQAFTTRRAIMRNLDQVAQIEPLDSGDARLTLRDGSVVPVSRRYRDALGR